MVTPTVRTNADSLSRAIREWSRLSGKSLKEAVDKQGTKLGVNLVNELKKIAPRKGSIRSEMIAALKSGQSGIRVRPAVVESVMRRQGAATDLTSRGLLFGAGKKKYRSRVERKTGKRVNLRNLMVRAELNWRERARAFLSAASRFKQLPKVGASRAISRWGRVIASAIVNGSETNPEIRFHWGQAIGVLSARAAEGLTKRKGLMAVASAMRITEADIMVYVKRKQEEAMRRAMSNVARALL